MDEINKKRYIIKYIYNSGTNLSVLKKYFAVFFDEYLSDKIDNHEDKSRNDDKVLTIQVSFYSSRNDTTSPSGIRLIRPPSLISRTKPASIKASSV